MEQQIFKAVRLPRSVVRSIERITKEDGSTFSQFLRTPAIKELNARKAAKGGPMEMVKLGDICLDSVTGYQGTVVCIAQWLHGCRRITLQAHGLQDGKIHDVLTVDEPQVKVVKSNTHQSITTTGGPRPDPIKR